jgi:hypothetical protein
MLTRTLSLSIVIILANAMGGKLTDAYLDLGHLMSSRLEAAINGRPTL